eukprot:NODE_585_length_6408_cov_0.301950.p1 type:complete len:1101 gc:universal NODE_585_length_6408_cov_0.301950:5272-1970(-)
MYLFFFKNLVRFCLILGSTHVSTGKCIEPLATDLTIGLGYIKMKKANVCMSMTSGVLNSTLCNYFYHEWDAELKSNSVILSAGSCCLTTLLTLNCVNQTNCTWFNSTVLDAIDIKSTSINVSNGYFEIDSFQLNPVIGYAFPVYFNNVYIVLLCIYTESSFCGSFGNIKAPNIIHMPASSYNYPLYSVFQDANGFQIEEVDTGNCATGSYSIAYYNIAFKPPTGTEKLILMNTGDSIIPNACFGYKLHNSSLSLSNCYSQSMNSFRLITVSASSYNMQLGNTSIAMNLDASIKPILTTGSVLGSSYGVRIPSGQTRFFIKNTSGCLKLNVITMAWSHTFLCSATINNVTINSANYSLPVISRNSVFKPVLLFNGVLSNCLAVVNNSLTIEICNSASLWEIVPSYSENVLLYDYRYFRIRKWNTNYCISTNDNPFIDHYSAYVRICDPIFSISDQQTFILKSNKFMNIFTNLCLFDYRFSVCELAPIYSIQEYIDCFDLLNPCPTATSLEKLFLDTAANASLTIETKENTLVVDITAIGATSSTVDLSVDSTALPTISVESIKSSYNLEAAASLTSSSGEVTRLFDSLFDETILAASATVTIITSIPRIHLDSACEISKTALTTLNTKVVESLPQFPASVASEVIETTSYSHLAVALESTINQVATIEENIINVSYSKVELSFSIAYTASYKNTTSFSIHNVLSDVTSTTAVGMSVDDNFKSHSHSHPSNSSTSSISLSLTEQPVKTSSKIVTHRLISSLPSAFNFISSSDVELIISTIDSATVSTSNQGMPDVDTKLSTKQTEILSKYNINGQLSLSLVNSTTSSEPPLVQLALGCIPMAHNSLDCLKAMHLYYLYSINSSMVLGLYIFTLSFALIKVAINFKRIESNEYVFTMAVLLINFSILLQYKLNELYTCYITAVVESLAFLLVVSYINRIISKQVGIYIRVLLISSWLGFGLAQLASVNLQKIMVYIINTKYKIYNWQDLVSMYPDFVKYCMKCVQVPVFVFCDELGWVFYYRMGWMSLYMAVGLKYGGMRDLVRILYFMMIASGLEIRKMWGYSLITDLIIGISIMGTYLTIKYKEVSRRRTMGFVQRNYRQF